MGFELLDLALVSALGEDKDVVRKNLFNSKIFNSLSKSEDYLLSQECLVGKINDEILEDLPDTYKEINSRFSSIILHLYRSLESSIDELKKVYQKDRIAVVIGTSTSGIDKAETPFISKNVSHEFPDDYFFFNQELGVGSSLISKLAGITGPSYSVSTACSSSAKVFKCAQNLLKLNIADAVILGGVDSLCKMTVRGFKSLDLLSEERSNPMSINRKGLNIGEGGALFTMIRSDQGIQLAGVGESTDAYHISAPDPVGNGAKKAILDCIDEANAELTDIAYFNLHGTGTVLNDAMESAAIAQIPELLNTKCSSTKPLTGHMLGASGAFEIGLCWLSLSNAGKSKPLPRHLWDEKRDPNLHPLNLTNPDEFVNINKESLFLSNSFGFGGSNCCVAIKCVD